MREPLENIFSKYDFKTDKKLNTVSQSIKNMGTAKPKRSLNKFKIDQYQI